MNTKKVTHNYRQNQWTEVIRECRSSGQTVSVWCANHNINLASYYYWLKRIRIAACEALPDLGHGTSQIVPLKIPVKATDAVSVKRESSSDIILRYGSFALELHNNASVELIENTLRALQNVR